MGRFGSKLAEIGDYVFNEEFDTGGCCSPYDYNIWVSHKTDRNFSACRTWYNGNVPHKKHLYAFCNKFATDETYRQKYIIE